MSSTDKADIYLLCDNTGSMEAPIQAVQNGIRKLLEHFRHETGWEIAAGVASYRDTDDLWEPAFEVQQTPTTSIDRVEEGTVQWSASGGGDEAEAQLSALYRLAEDPNGQYGWRPGAQRVVVWIGDAPGHDPMQDGAVSATEVSAIQRLVDQGITVLPFDILPNAGLDKTGQATRIAQATGGTYTPNVDPDTMVQVVHDALQKHFGPKQQPPIANAGDDVASAPLNQAVHLDGSKSSDPNHDALTWSWVLRSKPPGSTAALHNADSKTPELTPDAAGDYTIELVVNDGHTDSVADTVIVHAVSTNKAPDAEIRDVANVTVNQPTPLDGTGSTDPDSGDQAGLIYHWTLKRPKGSKTTLQDANHAKASFTPDIEGNYTVTLTVTDAHGASNSETKVFQAVEEDTRPVIFNGDQDIELRQRVRIEPKVQDADGDKLKYQWAVHGPDGKQILSSKRRFARFLPKKPGDYVIDLTVTDEDGNTEVQTFTYTANIWLEIHSATSNNQTIELVNHGPDAYDLTGDFLLARRGHKEQKKGLHVQGVVIPSGGTHTVTQADHPDYAGSGEPWFGKGYEIEVRKQKLGGPTDTGRLVSRTKAT